MTSIVSSTAATYRQCVRIVFTNGLFIWFPLLFSNLQLRLLNLFSLEKEFSEQRWSFMAMLKFLSSLCLISIGILECLALKPSEFWLYMSVSEPFCLSNNGKKKTGQLLLLLINPLKIHPVCWNFYWSYFLVSLSITEKINDLL